MGLGPRHITPTASSWGSVMRVQWSRPLTLNDFPRSTRVRLRQLEPNREIHIYTVEAGLLRPLLVRRLDLDHFQRGVVSPDSFEGPGIA